MDKKTGHYLHDCLLHENGLRMLRQPFPVYENSGSLPVVPSAKWFLSAYIHDVWSRLPEIKAIITSTFGKILKIDTAKKICKKLQDLEASSASWVVNVGNTRGEIL